MDFPFVTVKKHRTLLLTASAVALFAVSMPVQAQEDIPIPDTPPANILDGENTPETANNAEPPSAEALDDLDRQLENIQKMIDQANTESEANGSGLPVIDTENDPDVFYDSMPVRRGVQPTAPEKVDPLKKPAGKVVYVKKDFDAGEDQSMLVSAQRALSLGRYDSALGFYDQLYKKNPRDARVLMGRAIALQNLGRIQTAIQTYEALLEVDPSNVEAEISMLGLVKQRFPALALKRLLEMYEDEPNNPAINVQIGMAYAQIGNMREALRYIGTAVALEPNNASYYYNLAVVSDRAGQFKQALKYYEEALSKDATYGGSNSIPRDAVYERLSVIRKRI